MLKRKARNQDGFTLIELIVVVAILGILAAVLTPRVLDAVENARESAAESTGKQIQLAMERYMIANDQFPAAGSAAGQVDTIAELVGMLDDYISVAATQFSSDTGDFAYTRTAASGGTPETYSVTIELVDPHRSLVITPTGITVSDGD